MIEHLLEQLAELYSKHDLVKMVSLAGKTIQDAEMFEQLDVSNDLNLSSKRNAELNVGRFLRIMLGIVGGGIGTSPDVVIVAMVEGVTIGVGVSRDTIGKDVVVKIDSTPTSLIG
nr:hypothetical protein [Tanacetum cinerariifolium]